MRFKSLYIGVTRCQVVSLRTWLHIKQILFIRFTWVSSGLTPVKTAFVQVATAGNSSHWTFWHCIHNSKRQSQHLLSNRCRKMQARRWASSTSRGYSAPSSLVGQSSQIQRHHKDPTPSQAWQSLWSDLVPSRALKRTLCITCYVVHYAVSFNSAFLKVLSRTNGRLPLSSQSTREIPSLIQLSTGQFPCWVSLARWSKLWSTSSFRTTCSTISWSPAGNLASDHTIALPTFSLSFRKPGMHL